jgi:hypothetical protein
MRVVHSLQSIHHHRQCRGAALRSAVGVYESAISIYTPQPRSTCSRSTWAETVGVHAGLLPASDGAGDVIEVLDTWGDVRDLEGVVPFLTDRFRGRAFVSERAALGPPGALLAPGLR